MDVFHILICDLHDGDIIDIYFIFSIRCSKRSRGPSNTSSFTGIPIAQSFPFQVNIHSGKYCVQIDSDKYFAAMQSADSNNILRHSVSDPPSAIPWDYGFSQVWCVPLLLRLPAYADPSCGNLRSRTSEMDEAVGKAGHCACQVLQSLHDNAHSGSDPHPSQNRYLHIWDCGPEEYSGNRKMVLRSVP